MINSKFDIKKYGLNNKAKYFFSLLFIDEVDLFLLRKVFGDNYNIYSENKLFLSEEDIFNMNNIFNKISSIQKEIGMSSLEIKKLIPTEELTNCFKQLVNKNVFINNSIESEVISLLILNKIKTIRKIGKGSLKDFLYVFGFNFSSLKKLEDNLTKNELDEFNIYLAENSLDFNDISLELRNLIIKVLKVLIYYRKEVKLEDLSNKYDNNLSGDTKLEEKSYRYKMFFNENYIPTDKIFLEAFSKLTAKQKRYLGLYFGIDCEAKGQKEIASIYKDDFYNVCNIISVAKKDLLKYINEKEVKPNNKFTEFLVENNISRENFNKAFNLLKPKQKEYLRLFLGFNCKSLTVKEICELKKANYSSVYNSIDIAKKNIIKNIKTGKINKAKKNSESKKHQQETLTAFLKDNNISEEDFNKALNLLRSKQKEYIELYFGINGTILSLKEISELKVISYTSVCSTIKRAKENIIEFVKSGKINKPLETPVKNKVRQQETLQLFLEKNNISEEDFNTLLKLIGKKQRECLRLYFGIDCEKLSISDISKKLGKSYFTVNNNIILGKKNIIKNIEAGNKAIRNQTLDEFLEENNINKEEFMTALMLISELQRQCIKMYFGIECDSMRINEISKELNENYSAINKRIVKGKKQLIKNIRNGKIKDVKINLLKDKLNELYKFLVKDEKFKKIVLMTNPIGATALSLISEFNFNLTQLSKVLYMSKDDVINLLMEVSQIADNYDNDTEKIDDLCFWDNNDKKYGSSYKIKEDKI